MHTGQHGTHSTGCFNQFTSHASLITSAHDYGRISPGDCHHTARCGISIAVPGTATTRLAVEFPLQPQGLPPHGSLWNFHCSSRDCHHTARCGISIAAPGTATTGRPVALPHSPGDCHHKALPWHFPTVPATATTRPSCGTSSQSRRLSPQTPASSPLAGLAAL